MLLYRDQYQQFKMVAQTGEQSFGVDCSRLLEFQLCFDQEQNRWCFKKKKRTEGENIRDVMDFSIFSLISSGASSLDQALHSITVAARYVFYRRHNDGTAPLESVSQSLGWLNQGPSKALPTAVMSLDLVPPCSLDWFLGLFAFKALQKNLACMVC